MAAAAPAVIPFAPPQHGQLLPYLAALHASCITHDRTIATFLPPLSQQKLLAWWRERIAEVSDGKRHMWILVAGDKSGGKLYGPDVMGVVMLSMPGSETAPFRGVVENLLVSKTFRGRGGARALMGALEDEASRLGKTVLMLETEADSPAEALYKKLEYVELGRVPAFATSPSGEVKDVTFFYKPI